MQKYTDIPSSTSLSGSLSLILNNDKTALSCQAGSSFPTVDIRDGMLCFRTDHLKLYQCVDSSVPTWRVVADLSGDARNLDGGAGNVINYDKKNLNDWDAMPTGFYQGANMLNAPEGDTVWRVIQVRQGNSDGYSSQLAFGANSDKIYTRNQRGGMWTDWLEVWTGKKDKVVPGLNADRVDNLEPSNEAGQIPVNNGTLNKQLNADMVDGYHVGNKSAQIPLSNGVVNEGLNADTVDGFHAGNESGNVPVSNGKVNKNLNAEMVGGVSINNLLQLDGSGDVPRKIGQISIGHANVDNFGGHQYTGGNHPVREFNERERNDQYDQVTSSGSGNVGNTSRWHRISPAIGAGNYTLYQVLQMLVNSAHRHTTHKHTAYKNCNCRPDCNCDCDCQCDTDNGCFVSGKLLTTRGYVEVSELKVGDELASVDHKIYKVLGITHGTVGNRKVVKLADSVVTDEHVVFINGEPKVFTDRPLVSAVLEAENGVKGMYEIPKGTSKFNAWLTYEVDPNTPTYSPICEKSILVDMDGYDVLVAGMVNA